MFLTEISPRVIDGHPYLVIRLVGLHGGVCVEGEGEARAVVKAARGVRRKCGQRSDSGDSDIWRVTFTPITGSIITDQKRGL